MAGRATGLHRSTDTAAAEDAVRLAYSWLSRPHWYYLTVRGASITLVPHSGTVDGDDGYKGIYPLPVGFRDFYSVKVGFNLAAGEFPSNWLDFVDPGLADRMMDGVTASREMFYTTRTLFQAEKFQLLPFPSESGTLDATYFRRLVMPAKDADVLDVLEGPMENALVMYAGSVMATWDGKTDRRARGMRADAELMRREAMGMDKAVYGEMLEEIPQEVWARRRRALQTPTGAFQQYVHTGSDWEY
jgi:hypothetical protein